LWAGVLCRIGILLALGISWRANVLLRAGALFWTGVLRRAGVLLRAGVLSRDGWLIIERRIDPPPAGLGETAARKCDTQGSSSRQISFRLHRMPPVPA
jgi:hypothetical protein